MPRRQSTDPIPSTAIPRERLAMITFYVGVTQIMRDSTDPTGKTRDLDGLVYVRAGVQLGHLDGHPMTATQLGKYLGIPRNTVLYKLAKLEKLKLIECRNGRYYIHPERAANPPNQIVARYWAVFAKALAALGYSPDLAKYPKWTPPGL
jgi:hypothetical protein